MGDAIGPMLASAAGIAIGPVPLVATVLLLATARGRVKGAVFALGWAATLAAVTTAVVVLVGVSWTGPRGGAAGHGAGASWPWWVRLAVGLLLLLLGAGRWRERPREGHVHRPPRWMSSVDRLTPGRSAALAVSLVASDPKNPLVAVGGAVAIATSGGDAGNRALALALMVLLASLCVLVPLAVRLAGGEGADRELGEWKAWMSTHNAAIATVLPVVLGADNVGAALSGLTA
ncbi:MULTISPECIES: GAP family protein [Kitasatospora]|uniref:GAP family protein n=1 Tax=Kitasatospora cystarginea TaxID=58350 RepID=A0ABN3DIJ8_9ACTN